ncbi:hypothetical protein QQF64_033088 [Cirrhinus molitorella]|uniref:Uncharacterized protein n=1 Tax=Cirrhinus molitorella TaxID=172907 RepID=A0ABR3MSW3_9TELE
METSGLIEIFEKRIRTAIKLDVQEDRSIGFQRGGNLFVASCASSQSIGLYPFSLREQHLNTGPARKGRCQENPIPSGSIDL